ncbi:MAG: EF-hand domain-containing protein, partial [Phycisphaerae bacterium]|nr:EF-hand domain-containing protein [Phycisphaerae bacterium]
IKAILMASATHNGPSGSGLAWTNNSPTSGADRGSTARPLDELVGAGHLDVDRANLMMAGGETHGGNSVANATPAPAHGWSFDTISADEQRSFRFTMPEGADEFSALASWNRDVADNFGSFTLADLNLELLRLDDGVATPLVGNQTAWVDGNVLSNSSVDNVEHLYLGGLEAGDYIVQITSNSGSATDFAMAWYSSGTVESLFGDLNGDGMIGVDDLLQLLSAWGSCDGCEEDLNNDGLVGVDDLLAMLGVWP